MQALQYPGCRTLTEEAVKSTGTDILCGGSKCKCGIKEHKWERESRDFSRGKENIRVDILVLLYYKGEGKGEDQRVDILVLLYHKREEKG